MINYKIIEDIFEDCIKLLISLDIFNINIKNIFKKKKKRIINSILNQINEKKNLDGISNFIFTELQFNNVSGFNLVYNNAGQLHTPFIKYNEPNKYFITIYDKLKYNEKKTKNLWKTHMLFLLYKLFFNIKNKKVDYIITSLNEEWHEEEVFPDRVDEFVTLLKDNTKKYKHNLGEIVKPISIKKNICDINQLRQYIKHRIFQINKTLLVVNIHTSSNMNGEKSVNHIIKLLKNIITKYKDKTIIIGGDSNVYYGNVDKNGRGGIDDINYFYNELKKIDYNLIISKNIVAKYRPYNFFQNAQSASKGGNWMIEETMFISVPNNIKIDYDDKYYIKMNRKIKITDFNKDYCYTFIGTKYNKKYTTLKSHLEHINYNNFTKKLYSDHIPIYINFLYNDKTYRLIYSNNVSIDSNRGLNNNMKWFKIKDISILEKISKNEITNFLILKLETIFKNLKINIDFENKQKKTEYLKYLVKKDNIKVKINKKTKTKKKIKLVKKKTLFQKKWKQSDDCVLLY